MPDMFAPGRIANLDLKNRAVRSATYEALSDGAGKPTEKLARYIARLAEADIGLVGSWALPRSRPKARAYTA
jgi:2,4-dienoyl-CoA reductase-like NADH-dependent reductase (Old Yellow Enzyme family)